MFTMDIFVGFVPKILKTLLHYVVSVITCTYVHIYPRYFWTLLVTPSGPNEPKLADNSYFTMYPTTQT